MSSLASYGRAGTDAYDLVDRLRHGPERAAAWNAYVCQTYGDKLAGACPRPSDEAARVVRALYDLACTWLDRARGAPADLDVGFPPWGSPVRSRDELVGMRETLYALRTYVAYELGATPSPALDAVDRSIAAVDGLWIERPTPDLRAGIAGALIRGIRDAWSLGRDLALAYPE